MKLRKRGMGGIIGFGFRYIKLDVHTVGAKAKCKFSCTYTIHYIDKVFFWKAEDEAHAKSN